MLENCHFTNLNLAILTNKVALKILRIDEQRTN